MTLYYNLCKKCVRDFNLIILCMTFVSATDMVNFFKNGDLKDLLAKREEREERLDTKLHIS